MDWYYWSRQQEPYPVLVRGTYLTNQASMSGIGDIHWTAHAVQTLIDGSRPPGLVCKFVSSRT